MGDNKTICVYFPDGKALEEIREEAKRVNRGVGYILCEIWKIWKERKELWNITNNED